MEPPKKSFSTLRAIASSLAASLIAPDITAYDVGIRYRISWTLRWRRRGHFDLRQLSMHPPRGGRGAGLHLGAPNLYMLNVRLNSSQRPLFARPIGCFGSIATERLLSVTRRLRCPGSKYDVRSAANQARRAKFLSDSCAAVVARSRRLAQQLGAAGSKFEARGTWYVGQGHHVRELELRAWRCAARPLDPGASCRARRNCGTRLSAPKLVAQRTMSPASERSTSCSARGSSHQE